MIVKKLLQTRARFYSRAGKLLQGWPDTKYKLELALNKMETMYATELAACGGLAQPLPVLHDKPEMPLVADDPFSADLAGKLDKRKVQQASKEDEILTGGRVVTDDSGEVVLLADTTSASAGGESQEAKVSVQPYEIGADDCVFVEPSNLSEFGPVLFQRVAAHALMHAYLEDLGLAHETVKVCKVQANFSVCT